MANKELIEELSDMFDQGNIVVRHDTFRFLLIKDSDGVCFLDTDEDWADDFEDAKNFAAFSLEDQARHYARICMEHKEDNPGAQLAFVDMKVKTGFELVEMSDGEMLDAVRRAALSKLSHTEIKALGIEPLAVYNKVKFHGVDE